jgi:hypothetical protein
LADGEIRFYLDENLPVEIARQLASRGIEAVTARDLGLLGAADITHLARARELGYVFCTYDAGFIDLAVQGVEHAGIVFGQQDVHYIGRWVSFLELMHAVYSPEEMQNRVEYL